MRYLSGLGTIDSGYITTAGTTAKGKNSTVTAQFRQLQRVLNRYTNVAKFSALSADGVLGINTTAAVKKVCQYVTANVGGTSGQLIFRVGADATSPKDYAIYADDLAGSLDGIANMLGLPSFPSGPGGSPQTSSVPTTSGGSTYNPPAPPRNGPMAFLSTPMMIAGFPVSPVALLAAVGILGYRFIYKKKGKKHR